MNENEKVARGPDDQPATTLSRWLVTRGYAVQADEYWSESFGNRLVSLVRGEVRIELNKDRGAWSIGVGSTVTPKAGLYEPTLWRLVLQKVAPTEVQPAFADEAIALRAVLPAIEVALSTGWNNWQTLLRTRSTKLEQLLAKPPPGQALLGSALLIPGPSSDSQRAAMERVARAQRQERRHRQG